MQIRTWALLSVALSLTACNSSSSDPVAEASIPIEVDLPSGESVQRSLYISENKNSAEQYIRNYLLNEYGTLTEIHNEPQVAMPDATAMDAASDNESTLSSTNTIEQDVDEADFIKAFNFQSQDYLLTVTQPQYQNYISPEGPVTVDSATVSNPSPIYIGDIEPANLNLYAINETPSADLITRFPLSEHAQYVSGFYQFNEQVIVQSHLQNTPTQWQDATAWNNGKSTIESVKLAGSTLSNNWNLVFDGHIVASRRIDSDMFVLMRHASYPVGLTYPWGDINIHDANIELIDKLDFSAFIPNIQSNATTAAAFELEQCHLPDDTSRYLSGGIVFNYLAKVDLESGAVTAVQCVLADINQVYMNAQSLFLIDSDQWAEQTSRVHRFALGNLSYDSSIEVSGSLGWNSAEFRIKELADGTVVLVTSQNESLDNWGGWNATNTINKLQLFQKVTSDTGTKYQQIAELPNADYPETDESPLSLGKPGEQIYGVRIDESTVKVVTFQRTDPLYLFDISDRHNPQAVGELQENGVSVYLHNFADLTLGIGYDATDTGRRKGLKVELYEGQESVQSIEELLFGEYAYTPVDGDYHAFTSAPVAGESDRYRFAIPADIYGQDYQEDYTGLLLFTLDSTAKTLIHDGTIETDLGGSWQDRSVIQGNAVHYLHNGKIYSSLWSAPYTQVMSE